MKDQQGDVCQHDSSAIVTAAPGAPVCQHAMCARAASRKPLEGTRALGRRDAGENVRRENEKGKKAKNLDHRGTVQLVARSCAEHV